MGKTNDKEGWTCGGTSVHVKGAQKKHRERIGPIFSSGRQSWSIIVFIF
jgi:hypothetical protein